MGSMPFGIDPEVCREVAETIKFLHDSQVTVGVVVGGGNIFRGIKGAAQGMARTPADQVGMLATEINGIILQENLVRLGIHARLMSATASGADFVEPFNWQRSLECFDRGEVIIFVGGTGSPYFTTDTAAALRASEMGADCLLKATKVDGIYDKDPMKHADAKKFSSISYNDVLAMQLGFMDATAVALCRESHIPILVFDRKHIVDSVFEEGVGTLVN